MLTGRRQDREEESYHCATDREQVIDAVTHGPGHLPGRRYLSDIAVGYVVVQLGESRVYIDGFNRRWCCVNEVG